MLRAWLAAVMLLRSRLRTTGAWGRLRTRLRTRLRSRLWACWSAAYARARLEPGVLSGVRREPTTDRLPGRTVDQVSIDAFEASFRGPPRSAQDASLKLGLIGLPGR